MTAVALLKVTKEGRQELAYFDFAPRIPEPTDEERAVRALHDYDKRRHDLLDISRQEAVGTTNHLLCEAKADDPLLATYIRASGDLGIDKAIPCIAKYKDHPDPKVQLAVIRTFGQVMAIDHVPWLAGFATHKDPEFRKQAVVALGKIPHESVPPRLDAFAAADPSLRPEVDLGKEKIACFIDHPTEASVHRMIRLELGSDDYEDLVPKIVYVAKALDDIVKDEAAPVALRTRALRVLSLGRLAPLAATYVRLLGQKDEVHEDMRYEAIVALGRLRMRGADEALLEQVHTAEPRLRRAAIDALGQIRKASTLEPLLAAWDLEEGALRPAIFAAARKLAKFDGAPLLASALDMDRAAPSDALFFIDEASLTRGLRTDEVERHLYGTTMEARRDAVLLYAYFGPPERAYLLQELAQRETELELKAIAERGFARLDRVAQARRKP